MSYEVKKKKERKDNIEWMISGKIMVLFWMFLLKY